jgi:glutamyl-tRNA reductase
MKLLAVGCSHRSTPVAVREKLAFDKDKLPRALELLTTRLECEAVILSTCNRVELYLAQTLDRSPTDREAMTSEQIVHFLAEFHGQDPATLREHLYLLEQNDAVRHLFKVAASLDSLVVGEGQIAGQVKSAYEQAQEYASVGPILHVLFRQARQVARRVRSETGISDGHVSVSSAAVDYVKQVFDSFADKIILVIGAGKMGELTLKHLAALKPYRILVTNRSPEKAEAVAAMCRGVAMPWSHLDDTLAEADIILSTTGAPEPIVDRERWHRVQALRRARRGDHATVILDIAVPRDFDPSLHDGDRTCLFNIDDLKRLKDATMAKRLKHVGAAEAIVEAEAKKFLTEWAKRRKGPLIQKLTADFEAKRKKIEEDLFARLNGRLTEEDRELIAGAFRLLQNRFLHGPISALNEEAQQAEEKAAHGSLLDALRKLFWLKD